MNEIQTVINFRKLFNSIVEIVFNRQIKTKLFWAGTILVIFHAWLGFYGHFSKELVQFSSTELLVGGMNYFFRLLFYPLMLMFILFVMIRLIIFPLLFEGSSGKKRKKNVRKFVKHNIKMISLISIFLIFSISFGEIDFQIKAGVLILLFCVLTVGFMLRIKSKLFAQQLFLANLFLIVALQNEVISNMLKVRGL